MRIKWVNIYKTIGQYLAHSKCSRNVNYYYYYDDDEEHLCNLSITPCLTVVWSPLIYVTMLLITSVLICSIPLYLDKLYPPPSLAHIWVFREDSTQASLFGKHSITIFSSPHTGSGIFLFFFFFKRLSINTLIYDITLIFILM